MWYTLRDTVNFFTRSLVSNALYPTWLFAPGTIAGTIAEE